MQTALISALTAALVTLIIEYAAKPRLEARKDRIVAASRSRRELRAKYLALSYRADRVTNSIDKSIIPELSEVEALRAESLRLSEEITTLEPIVGWKNFRVIGMLATEAYISFNSTVKLLQLVEKNKPADLKLTFIHLRQYVTEARLSILESVLAIPRPRWRVFAWRRDYSVVSSRMAGLPNDKSS